MLGWEFPPFITGGLGTACFGLTKALNRLAIDVLFVLPRAIEAPLLWLPGEQPVWRPADDALADDITAALLGFEHVEFKHVPGSVPNPYGAARAAAARSAATRGAAAARSALVAAAEGSRDGASPVALRQTQARVIGTGAEGGYEGNMIEKVRVYAERCLRVTTGEEFAVVHAHDWITFPAAQLIARRADKPLVLHVHSTEFDRSGEQVNPAVYDIERQGVHAADRIIAVSHLTKRILVERYDVRPGKVTVVHNGIEGAGLAPPPARRPHRQKVVLFLGRITMQKGPEFFLRSAARVLARMDHVKFIIAGWGDMGPQLVEQVAQMGLGRKVFFTGFLRGKQVEAAFRRADVYVMPSISEPFGLTALEAIRYGTPVIISRNSGAAEVLNRGALKVDFWDVDDTADKILAVLNSPTLAAELRHHATVELRRLTWDLAARKCVRVYGQMLAAREGVSVRLTPPSVSGEEGVHDVI
jgi:glycosyltransferase involved in cell wall biosynthesis